MAYSRGRWKRVGSGLMEVYSPAGGHRLARVGRHGEEPLDQFAGLGVVQADRAVEAGRRDLLAAGLERHRVHGPAHTLERGDALAGRRLVHAGLAAAVEAAADREPAAVGVEAQGVDAARQGLVLPQL